MIKDAACIVIFCVYSAMVWHYGQVCGMEEIKMDAAVHGAGEFYTIGNKGFFRWNTNLAKTFIDRVDVLNYGRKP